ncbi:MAG: universal stress protein, partial [Brachybacterium sp.]|nr:universal stress protein [Brachybacterium sp.]
AQLEPEAGLRQPLLERALITHAPRLARIGRPLEERLAETGLGFELRTVPKRDDPADDILDAVEDDDVLMVVIGIRKRTPIGKILLGSTSQRVAIESPVPVVLVKPESFVAPTRF